MQCATCSRHHGPKLQFHCVACARHSLYELRISAAAILLERDALADSIEHQTEKGSRRSEAADAKPAGDDLSSLSAATRFDLDRAMAKREESESRTRDVRAHTEALRRDIEAASKEVSQLRSSLARRRSDNASATHELKARRAAMLASVERSKQRTGFRALQQHQRTAEARVFLCREAAALYGLRQRRRKKSGVVKEDYIIGGVGIIDLRDLNGAPPARITTSLTHVAHLLVLTSHYLSLQLPAEITLPHRDYPLPTIFTPPASYSSRRVPFPGTTPSHSSSNSPSASRTGDVRPLPRPRPLYLDKPLPVLAKEDPATYSLFIEGVSLLAWNIAWVCRTQGLHVASHSWEEVCPLGRNLWQLLSATTRPLPSSPSLSPSSTPSPSPSKRVSTPANNSSIPDNLLGHFSHGTAYGFLGAAQGVEHMRGWKLRSPTHIADKVKAQLLSEMAGAEWEMLEEREWDEAKREGAGDDPTPASHDDAPGDDEGGGDNGVSDGGRSTAAKLVTTLGGKSGWTKLRSRR